MAYTRINWQDLPSTATPRNATNLNKMDSAIKEHDDKLSGNTSMGDLVVDSIRSKNMWRPILLGNMYNCSVSLSGDIYTISATGTDCFYGNVATTSGTAYTTGMGQIFEVKPNTTYTFSVSNNNLTKNYVSYFNSSKNSISYQRYDSNSFSFTTPNNCYYVSFRIGDGNSSSGSSYTTTIQLEEGSTATSYSPYQDLNNEEIYSTGETKIGTWIDGKPIYRKVYTGTTSSGDGFVNLDTNIKAFFLKNATFPSLNYRDFTYYLDTTNNRAGLDIAITNTSTGLLQFRVLNTTLRSQSYIFIIEYTKTTD